MEGDTRAVEGLLDVQAGTSCDQSRRAEGDKLTSGSDHHVCCLSATPGRELNEALVDVEAVAIDTGARSAVAALNPPAVQLEEEADAGVQMKVGAKQISLQQVAIVRGLRSERRVVLMLAALSNLPADREKASTGDAERNVV